MAQFEALEDKDGNPILRIIAKRASPETLAELAVMGKVPGPDEAVIAVDAKELMFWVMESLGAEASKG